MDTLPLRTVIADDDETMRLLLRLNLDRDDRFEIVAAAADGIEAVDLVMLHEPALLVLDMEMPNRNGLEVLAHLAANPPGVPVTIVVLSAVGTSQLITQALRAGAAAFLDKAAVARDLPDRIHAAAMGGLRDS